MGFILASSYICVKLFFTVNMQIDCFQNYAFLEDYTSS